MKIIFYVVSLLVCIVTGAGSATAQNTPPAANPPAANPPVNPAAPGAPNVVRPGERPGQNRMMMRRGPDSRLGNRRRPERGGVPEREQKLRELMASFGQTDSAVQDEVVRYIGEDVRARQPLRRTTRQLYEAARNPATDDAKMAQLLKEYQDAVEADRIRRERAEAELNERIKYKSNPRLETMLLMFGVLGDRTMLIPMGPGINRNDRRPEGRPRFSPPNRRPDAVEPERGITTGTVVTKRESEIIIKPDNGGPNESYRLRRQNGVWDPVAQQIIAELSEGDTVQIRWVVREGKRIQEIKKVAPAPEATKVQSSQPQAPEPQTPQVQAPQAQAAKAPQE